ncbi:septal ring lytic transglycosylase RlpA family protein [Bradyrhizobium sp. ISRA443]|uniref:septal ring lytic transglycosylase RlpA family protein n=1 Tax=unclassified Bradyrhizobium TaxID=2631580 RepID=UPI00247A0440|nr:MULTISPECIES: septal ring lytic transglycosylase RlpA family protein [unclassified Bradyrhizobium]WGR91720.1 septal ring lytic transglycosylase RlpA family protein [Bradyrhizobium sp. ISRA435]WGS02058.1 septal ring lytic transglycosylase RlpA family protein [Bradyrhizobium sp. ISRA436]WGS08943.1 septal ring lytic transglycosylase RlpA family protein [Bradyrhizobium sp. ISRA437]WGS15832.1 septal ring lytic transglycosylase RlpA family protein [Bradyrhizobium sp. ISRA443]
MKTAATSAAMLLFANCMANAESGLASYYGGIGRRGEMTCAHRSRPFGSMITVSYRGRTIRCRVNDRGPFVRGRIIDVSTTAAKALGILQLGVAHVVIE